MPQPHLSYREILTTMVDANLHRTPREFVPEARRTLATILTFLLPKGCLIRTAQVTRSRYCCFAFIVRRLSVPLLFFVYRKRQRSIYFTCASAEIVFFRGKNHCVFCCSLSRDTVPVF